MHVQAFRRTFVITCLVVILLATRPALQGPGWAIACGDGRVDQVLDNFDTEPLAWSFCCVPLNSNIPQKTPARVTGCNGDALSLPYDLQNAAPDGQSWIVFTRSFNPPRNLSPFTHVRVAFRGTNINSHETVELKLNNGDNHFTASLNSMTDMVSWRPVYIDFREFTLTGAKLDLTNITGLEIGIKRCREQCEVFDVPAIGRLDEDTGTLLLDEWAVVDLKPGAANRVVQTTFESVTPNLAVAAKAADALRASIMPPGVGADLIPAWFTEAICPFPCIRNLNSYVQAEALLVFVYEYERTGNTAFRDAARNLAQRLIAQQIDDTKVQRGAWYTTHGIENNALVPPNRPIPSATPTRCDGNETMVADPDDSNNLSAKNIDACEWVGNVGWTLIALGKLQRSGIFPDAAALANALERGAAWIARQAGERGDLAHPHLVTLGVEGNISGYFGLLAAGHTSDAAVLANAIFQFAWDPVQRRIKPGARTEDAATAIDVSGSWGASFLRATGRMQDALDSMGYSASVMRAKSFDDTIMGYGDIAGPYTPALEFAGQAAAAGIKDADFVMQQLVPLQVPNGTFAGAFPGAPNHWYGGPLNAWITTMIGASPTAWMYFALCCDPFRPLVGFTSDSTVAAGPVIRAPFTDSTLTGGTFIVRAVHINELRAAIKALE